MNISNLPTTKQAIVPSKLPDADFVINPYLGCEFGCKYCYASFMTRFVGKPRDSWGSFAYPKNGFLDALKYQLRKPEKYKNKNILFGSVTDAYQPIEAQAQLTHGALEIFAEKNIKANLEVLTKSALVLRDVELFRELDMTVGVSLSILPDDKISQIEPKVILLETRIEVLQKLKDSGVKSYAFIGPVFPNQLAKLEKVLQTLVNHNMEVRYIEILSIKSASFSQKYGVEYDFASDYVRKIKELVGKYGVECAVLEH